MGDVCPTARQTAMKDGRRCSSNQTVEAACRKTSISKTKQHHKVETLQKQSNQRAPRPRQTDGGQRAVIGLLSKRAGFSSKQTSSITSFNSVRWKKRAGGQEGRKEAVGNAPGPGVALCTFSVVRLLKQCHPAISFVYLPDTTRGSTLSS